MSTERQTPMLFTGDRIGFGPLRSDLVETYQRWFNDIKVLRTLGAPVRPMIVESEQRWFEDALTSGDIHFTIYVLQAGEPIGLASLMNVDLINQITDFGMLIGETRLWNQGYGTEATRLMLDYAFDAVGLHNVKLEVYAHNRGGIRAYERAGFKLIGKRREAVRKGRRRYDVYYMDALESDFEPARLDDLLHPPLDPPR